MHSVLSSDLIQLRKYAALDKSSCLLAFTSNVPDFFVEQELDEYEKWLDELNNGLVNGKVSSPSNYYVLEIDNKVVACGGYGYNKATNEVTLAWGLTKKEFHKRGFGKRLLSYRLERIMEDYPIAKVLLDTTQYSFAFFEKYGFVTLKITNNFYAAGMHRYDMILELTRRLTIRALQKNEAIPYELLLLADETREAIDKYISNSEVFVCEIEKITIAAYVLKLVDSETIEIKNVAVDKIFQGKGIGTYLLKLASGEAKKRKFKSLLIGTGDKSHKQLQLYRKVGFKDLKIIKDFFVANYPEPIFENGEQLKDMIILKKEL